MDGARRKTVILLGCLLYNGEIMGLAIQIMIKKGLANKYSQQHSQNSARIVKLQKINNTFAHKNKPESAFTSISTIGYNAEKVQRKINLNDEILNRRKQNYLNTQYNRRLNNLKTITKENKKIYQRINSQKSLYSQEDMRRSSLSIRSSKSSSRVSNKSGLKQPMKNSKSYKPTQAKVAMTIQPQSVGNMKGQNLKQFQSVFMIGKKYSHHSKEGFAVPKRENRSFSLRNNNEAVQDQQKMGNMLHKIAEEMYKRSEKKPVYNKRKILY